MFGQGCLHSRFWKISNMCSFVIGATVARGMQLIYSNCLLVNFCFLPCCAFHSVESVCLDHPITLQCIGCRSFLCLKTTQEKGEIKINLRLTSSG